VRKTEQRDSCVINAAATRDADGKAWFQAIASGRDATRICGFSAHVLHDCREASPGVVPRPLL
jgi:hypothetical protein